MKKLTCVAKVIAKKENKDLVLSDLSRIVSTSRNEDGYINYDLHIDNGDDSVPFL